MSGERSDHELITDVLVRYATGIDTKDWPLFRTCFTDDVHADHGPDVGMWNDVDEITEYMTVMHRDMRDTKHMLSNFAIELGRRHGVGLHVRPRGARGDRRSAPVVRAGGPLRRPARAHARRMADQRAHLPSHPHAYVRPAADRGRGPAVSR